VPSVPISTGALQLAFLPLELAILALDHRRVFVGVQQQPVTNRLDLSAANVTTAPGNKRDRAMLSQEAHIILSIGQRYFERLIAGKEQSMAVDCREDWIGRGQRDGGSG